MRAPLIERQTVEQMMASARDRSSAQDALRLPPDEERRIIHQGLTDHYRRTLDEPIPSLGNQSPRKAAKTGKGREKVIGWLALQPYTSRAREDILILRIFSLPTCPNFRYISLNDGGLRAVARYSAAVRSFSPDSIPELAALIYAWHSRHHVAHITHLRAKEGW